MISSFSDSLVILKVFVQGDEATFHLKDRLMLPQLILDLSKPFLEKLIPGYDFYMPLPGCLLHGAGEVGRHPIVCSDLVIVITASEVGQSYGFLFFKEV